MIFVEPTPCGHLMFGSSLISVGARLIQITASRAIEKHQHQETMQRALERTAQEVIGDLMSQASQCGLTTSQIHAMLHATPELALEHRRAT